MDDAKDASERNQQVEKSKDSSNLRGPRLAAFFPYTGNPRLYWHLQILRNAFGSNIGENNGTLPGGCALNILFIDECIPEPDRNGSSLRAQQIIEGLTAAGHKIVFIGKHRAPDSLCTEWFKERAIEFYSGDSARIPAYRHPDRSWSFTRVLQSRKFDAAILALWFWNDVSVPEDYLWEIRQRSPDTPVVVLTDDRHGLRQRLVAESTQLLFDAEAAIDHEKRERQVYANADFVIAISELERQAVQATAPDTAVAVAPIATEPSGSIQNYESRNDIVFLGNFENGATRDAANWLLDTVWPLIYRQMPDISLTLAGNRAFGHMAVKGPNNTRCVGHVANLPQLLDRHRVFVAPIRFGTGIATKNLTAMSHGIPVVTTTLGAQSLNVTNGVQVMLADTAKDFAAKVVSVYSNRTLWTELVDRAHAHLRANFSRDSLNQSLVKIMDAVRSIAPKQAIAHPVSFCCGDDIGLRNQSDKSRRRPELVSLLHAITAGELSLRERRPLAAIEQLRYAASLLISREHDAYYRTSPSRQRLLRNFQRCYQALGDHKRAILYGNEANQSVGTLHLQV